MPEILQWQRESISRYLPSEISSPQDPTSGLNLVQTTERYLGSKQRIRAAVNDRIGFDPAA
jgi:hypothetical protein